LGLNVKINRLLSIDYYPKTGRGNESIRFVFYGGIFNKKQIANIKLSEEELTDFKFYIRI